MKDDFFTYPDEVMPELKYQPEKLRPKRCGNCKNTFIAREGYISGIGCSLMEDFAIQNGYNTYAIVYKKNGKKVLYSEVDYNGTCVKWKSKAK